MNRPELIDTAPIPNDGGELRLFREGPHFAIKIAGGGELMHSRTHGSEDKLAEITCTRIAGRPQPRVLIGGLGMGFTLAAALKHLGTCRRGGGGRTGARRSGVEPWPAWRACRQSAARPSRQRAGEAMWRRY
jgi:hypothetical protein